MSDHLGGTTGRDEALERVLAFRGRARNRCTLSRIAFAVLGGALFIASIPLVILLPEAGVPAMLVGLRLLAAEADWAASAYAWIDWRYVQARRWSHRQSVAVRAVIILVLLAVAVALVWLLVHEFA